MGTTISNPLHSDGQPFVIKRLTMKDIRQVLIDLREAKDQQPHPVDMLFNHDVPVCALKAATGITDEELDTMGPEEVFGLLERVQEVNAFFFQTMATRFYTQETPKQPSLTGSAT